MSRHKSACVHQYDTARGALEPCCKQERRESFKTQKGCARSKQCGLKEADTARFKSPSLQLYMQVCVSRHGFHQKPVVQALLAAVGREHKLRETPARSPNGLQLAKMCHLQQRASVPCTRPQKYISPLPQAQRSNGYSKNQGEDPESLHSSRA